MPGVIDNSYVTLKVLNGHEGLMNSPLKPYKTQLNNRKRLTIAHTLELGIYVIKQIYLVI